MTTNLRNVAEYLDGHDLTVVTAESCTAGLIAGTLADMPGCGSWFKLGYVTYSAGAKNKVLGVRFETIDEFNLTSEEVAREMAEGVLRLTDASVAVADTGLAGPDDQDGIPAGTVCFAWGFRLHGNPKVITETRHFSGDRNQVRRAAADYAIDRIPELHASVVGSTNPI